MATPARTVQLKSATQVIEAYQNWDNPQFAILNGKQLLFAYDNDNATIEEGDQLLQQWLTWIKSGGSAGIYTLAIYKDTKKGITNATPYNGSINFQLNEYNYDGNRSVSGVSDAGLKMILDKMEAMQLQITKLQQEQDDDGDDDDSGDTLGQITNLLNNPVVAGIISAMLPNGIKQVKQPPSVQPMHPIANEPGHVARINGTNVTDGDGQKKMADALAKLKVNVSNLPEVLEQLGKLSEQKPIQFKFYVATLMNMKL